jgi:hypothetical protein
LHDEPKKQGKGGGLGLELLSRGAGRERGRGTRRDVRETEEAGAGGRRASGGGGRGTEESRVAGFRGQGFKGGDECMVAVPSTRWRRGALDVESYEEDSDVNDGCFVGGKVGFGWQFF